MRVEFAGVGQLIQWMEEVVTPEKYDLFYIPNKRQLIAIKNVSTSPRTHAIVRDVGQDEAHQARDQLPSSYMTAVDFRWKTDVEESS
jgi:hypothetical protein